MIFAWVGCAFANVSKCPHQYMEEPSHSKHCVKKCTKSLSLSHHLHLVWVGMTLVTVLEFILAPVCNLSNYYKL